MLRRLDTEGLTVAESTGPKKARRVVSPSGLLDLWAEEEQERMKTARAYLYARSPDDLARSLSKRLAAAGVEHAITRAAAANRLAPFVTAVPVVDVWHGGHRGPEDVCEAAGAELVAEGSNILLRRAAGDGPLAFRELQDGVYLANRFRVYLDLRQDPRRGEEQAQHLRTEVIGF